jgi:hypothetical protein
MSTKNYRRLPKSGKKTVVISILTILVTFVTLILGSVSLETCLQIEDPVAKLFCSMQSNILRIVSSDPFRISIQKNSDSSTDLALSPTSAEEAISIAFPPGDRDLRPYFHTPDTALRRPNGL